MSWDPFLQVVGKAAAHPGFIGARIHADPVRAPGHVAAQLDVVTGGDPGSALGVHAILGLAQDALLHGVGGERQVEGRRLQLAVHVVDHDDGRAIGERGGDPFPPLVVVVVGSCDHSGLASCGDHGHRFGQQRLSGARSCRIQAARAAHGR